MFLASMLANTAVNAVTRYFSNQLPLPSWVLYWAAIVFSLVATSLFLTVIFRVLPNAKVRWRDILVGACLTAILFTIGNYLIGRYLGRFTPGSIFGAFGSLAVIMVWMYFCAHIVLFGAEITRAYARRNERGLGRTGVRAGPHERGPGSMSEGRTGPPERLEP